MSKKYYIQNMFWGYFIVVGIFYSFWSVEKDYKFIVLSISAISGVLYPFAKLLIERVVIKHTGDDFWHKGLIEDGVPKSKMRIFYYSFCLLFAIPLGVTCILIELRNWR